MKDQKKLELITSIVIAVSNCALYSQEHSIVRSLAEKAKDIIDDLIGDNESLEVMIIDNDLVFDNNPLKNKTIHTGSFIKKIHRKGVDKIIFKKGLETAELLKLITEIADSSRTVSQSLHISTGSVEVRLGDLSSITGFTKDEVEKFRSDQVTNVKEVFGVVSRYKKLVISGLEDIVINFISAFRKEVNILNIMSPFKSYSEFTYTHAANVAVLTLFQAESLGIKGDLLHDIGIAALLHDVGKMFVSNDILEKIGKLDEDEWNEIKRHTLYGAKYLMGQADIPRIAVSVAFEHHLRYDCKGYPETKLLKTKQHICSQIVALSDGFDAGRAARPYKQGIETVDLLSFIRKSSGTLFNPVLVNNFVKNYSNTLKFQQ